MVGHVICGFFCRLEGVELNEEHEHAVTDPDKVADEVAKLVHMCVSSLSISYFLFCVIALIYF